MGQQDASDEVMLQRAGDSAGRVLQHLTRHAAGNNGKGAMPAATVAPVNELEAAIISLRMLIAELQKEPGTQ